MKLVLKVGICFSLFLVISSLTASLTQAAQVCVPIENWGDYQLCLSNYPEPLGLLCHNPEFCCYNPPADPNVQLICPVAPSPIPCQVPPYSCQTFNYCDNLVPHQICPGSLLCCSNSPLPTATIGPTPTISVGVPPDDDPTCGADGQSCCNALPGFSGDCDSNPTGLSCRDNAYTSSTCCFQNDTLTQCFTAIGVTPIVGDPTINPFCDDQHTILDSAIGCLPVNNLSITIGRIISWATIVAGGIAFVLLIIAGFQLATSAGDPKRAQAAKELISSALAGLVLIALSAVILNFLGVTILNLSGLGFSG